MKKLLKILTISLLTLFSSILLVGAWNGLIAQNGDIITISKWNQLLNLVNTKQSTSITTNRDDSNINSTSRLSDSISRKEFMKIIAKVEGGNILDKCEKLFTDIPYDWSCKYIVFGVKQGFLAKNKLFRPDDNISKAEALKLIFKSRSLSKKYFTSSWQANYVNSAYDLSLIESKNFNYNEVANRSWIFKVVAKTFSDFSSQSGQVSIKKTIIDGKIEGEVIEYYSNGNIKTQTYYVKGVLHGPYKSYYRGGSLNFESYYKDGITHGTTKKYFSDGTLSQSEDYYKGQLTGFVRVYDKSGKLTKKQEYIGGVFLSEEVFE